MWWLVATYFHDMRTYSIFVIPLSDTLEKDNNMESFYYSMVMIDLPRILRLTYRQIYEQATIINGTDQNPSFPCPMIQPLLSDCAI